uniref:type II toxin-antitoxin system RelE/ParE family toxin n=1 Tax=Marinobacterium jannaschii TaxID=64970 RepID=UPI000486543B|nr:type II toxin-antitoxin system RelE/ParE family toxin [Marinobacterium jannaschii]
MAISFRDPWLEEFYYSGARQRQIPIGVENTLRRKLQIVDASADEADLIEAPSNGFQWLDSELAGFCTIRVNRVYRLVFRMKDGQKTDLFFEEHRIRER